MVVPGCACSPNMVEGVFGIAVTVVVVV